MRRLRRERGRGGWERGGSRKEKEEEVENWKKRRKVVEASEDRQDIRRKDETRTHFARAC